MKITFEVKMALLATWGLLVFTTLILAAIFQNIDLCWLALWITLGGVGLTALLWIGWLWQLALRSQQPQEAPKRRVTSSYESGW